MQTSINYVNQVILFLFGNHVDNDYDVILCKEGSYKSSTKYGRIIFVLLLLRGEFCMRAIDSFIYTIPLLLSSTIIFSEEAKADEDVTYCYDALGRLTQVGKVGGPASGKKVTTSFDPAGNRSNQTTANGSVNCASSAPPPPPPPPAPPPPPPPPPSVITLTNSNLTVLAAHAGTYTCNVYNFPAFNINTSVCLLNGPNVEVYRNDNGAITSDPGYVVTNGVLTVQSNYYGTGS